MVHDLVSELCPISKLSTTPQLSTSHSLPYNSKVLSPAPTLFRVSVGQFKLWLDVTMAGVIRKFFIASMFMWVAPVAILYGFNHNLLPGSTQLSPHSLTLVSGFLAVISVNVVIALYVYMAMKEPSDKHEPDPAFLAEAKASVSQSTSQADNSSQPVKKQQ
ncbi:hypothetical protein F2P56_007140 [Juglans regia]|uniref:Vacuolar ATPase assembly integral membrane protein VMA21 homolog n=2 Tax=Juglans regia TaxID=51240 RepID=A0A833Y1G8_JUGRE|nr:hypothetical protein F2P56_007140 [Juglans regia]